MRASMNRTRVARLPSLLAALLLVAAPVAGDEVDEAPPAAPDAAVEVQREHETIADEDSAPAHAAGVGHWLWNDGSQDPVLIFNPARSGHPRSRAGEAGSLTWQSGAEGCLLLTIEPGEGRDDFVLGKTAQQIVTGSVCANDCRCPHCGATVTPLRRRAIEVHEACPPLQAGEPAKEIMDIREQLNATIGLPNWEVDFPPGTAAREDGREVMIHVIRRMDAQERDADRYCTEECGTCCPAEESGTYCPAEETCPADDATVASPPQHMLPPQAIAWNPLAPPVEVNPEQRVVHMLRETSHQLDCAAHLLETQQQYEQADQLRGMASQLRIQAREAQFAIDQPEPPQPMDRAEYSEAGLRHEIHQLREELRRSRPANEAHYRPSRMER